jgi:hypothetical protein
MGKSSVTVTSRVALMLTVIQFAVAQDQFRSACDEINYGYCR